MSVDPALAETNEPYAYADDDPVNESDPSGDASCGPGAGPRKVFDTYPAQSPLFGTWTVTLYCGVAGKGDAGIGGYGYGHLLPHVAESKMPNWSYFNFFIGQTLKKPATVSYQQGNDTWAYTAPAEGLDYQGNVIYKATFYVIVTANQQKPWIITAFARNPQEYYPQLVSSLSSLCAPAPDIT